MPRLSPTARRAVLALAGATLVTWTTRVPLYLTDDALSPAEKVLATLPVLAFVALGVAALVTVLRRSPAAGAAGAALAGWSLAYWAVRLPLIAAHGHPVGFLVVHAVLALVAGTLAVVVLVRLAADGAGPWSRSRARGRVPDGVGAPR